jgi:hypothetical protein
MSQNTIYVTASVWSKPTLKSIKPYSTELDLIVNDDFKGCGEKELIVFS